MFSLTRPRPSISAPFLGSEATPRSGSPGVATIGAIVARSFARIFYRNALNLGLPALVCADLEAARGDELEVRPAEGRILNHSSGRQFACEPIPPQLMEIVAGGGLMPWLERKLAAERGA